MLFSSSVFLFLFLPIVLILYFNPIVKNRIYRNIILLVASLFFYAWGEPVFVLLMVASIVVNWLIGLAMAGSGRKKTWLVLSVVWNLSLMFVFKYLTFVLFSVIFLISIMGTQRCRRIVISLRSMCLCSHNWWQDLSCVMNRLRMRLTTGRRIWRIFPSV